MQLYENCLLNNKPKSIKVAKWKEEGGDEVCGEYGDEGSDEGYDVVMT